MPATRKALVVDQGADFVQEWQWLVKANPTEEAEPRDLTGWTARMQIRRSTSAEKVLAELTTANGLLLLNHEGLVRIKIPAEVSTEWDFSSGVYDLENVDPDGGVTRFAGGRVTVTPEVTR